MEFIFALELGGNLRLYPGNYSVYLDTKHAEQKAIQHKNNQRTQPAAKTPKKATTKPDQPSTKVKRLSNFERREYEKLETKVVDLETEKENLEQSLAANASNYEQVQKLSDQLAKLNQELDQATERWLELAERDV